MLTDDCNQCCCVVIGDGMAKRHVLEDKPVIMLLLDVELADGALLDWHFRFVCDRETTMLGFHDMIRKGNINIVTRTVRLLVGNCQIPISKHVGPVGQTKKLVNTIIKAYPLLVHKIVVAGILPRPDREVGLEADVKDMNKGMAQAVQELKRYHHVGKRVEYLPVHKIFLEHFQYCDLQTGQLAMTVHVVRPKDQYFVQGTPKLNFVGLYHLKSYLLQSLGVLEGINSWTGILKVWEHPEMQAMKKQAWIKAHVEGTGIMEAEMESEGTDLEEGSNEGVVADTSMPTTPGRRAVDVSGRRMEAFDSNLDFDETVERDSDL